MAARAPKVLTSIRSTSRRGTGQPIRFRCSLNNTILDVLRARGWQEVTNDEEEWDFFWCERDLLKETFDRTYLPEHARICHFRNHYELTKKNMMVKNLKRLKKQREKDAQGKSDSPKIDFFPTTFELPSEYHMFLEEFRRIPNIIWIMKPAGKSQGKGIFLFKRIKDIEAWKKGEYQTVSDPNREAPETYVVSRYIENPYLICGRKFDLRVYVMVTSYNPLKAWLYRDGFARFSNTRFTLQSLDDNYVHLTNVAIQKTAPDYDADRGCKWSVIRLRKYLTAKHGIAKVEELFRRIDNIFIQSLLSVQKIMINDKHCFELYGYDILLDDKLKPWLLEINAAPSLTASSKEDYDLKFNLLNDVLDIVDMDGRLTGKEKKVGGFDLIWMEGPVTCEEFQLAEGVQSANYSTNSFLGCHNDRDVQLKKLNRELKLAKISAG